MAATEIEVSEWFDAGVAKKAAYMLVFCDTFDYGDYPVYAESDDDCRRRYQNPAPMQRVLEVYDLNAAKIEQLREKRCVRLPAGAGLGVKSST